MDVEDVEPNNNIEDPKIEEIPNTPETQKTPARILNVVTFEKSFSLNSDSETIHNKKSKISIVEKRKRMMRRNAISNFFTQGKRSISIIFPANYSPEEIKWKDISPKFRTKKKKKHQEEIIKERIMRQMSSPPRVTSDTRDDTLNHLNSTKESVKPISNVVMEEFASELSILSSYPIMTMIEEFIKEKQENDTENNLEELFNYWINTFIDTCHKQIKNIVLSTNQSLSQHIDLNGNDLINGHQNFIKVLTIPTWPQVRILKDKTNQNYIALKKSHSLSWFVLPRECPKLNQQWICYPIHSINTFENEQRMTEENSIQRVILRMIMLKCFNKIHKNDIVPINFDINNILLVSSSCGLIVAFKEEKHELDIKTFSILRSDSLNDIPKQWSIVRQEVKENLIKFFYRINIISILISSTWPVDYMAYILAKLMMESDN